MSAGGGAAAGRAARRAWRDYALVFAAGVIGYGALALWAGQDRNWDLQNYHDYAAYALLHWRYPIDVAPGGPQSYLNPLPYLLPYLIRHHLPMRVGAVLIAATQAALPVVLWALAGRLVPAGTPGRRPLRALATIAGSTGAMTLSEIGTSFADLPLALPSLAALTLLLAADGAVGRRRPWMLAGAGFLAGAAAGLKLTNLIGALALGLAALLPWRRGARGVAAAVWTTGLLVVSGVASFTVSDGWWAAFLWHAFGSPTFPFMNLVFRAPSAVAMNFTDPRFLPHGWWDALTYPWQIAAGRAPTAEVPFADPRLLAGLAVALVTLAASVTAAGRAATRAAP
ncbi:glycosyltransferase 87 family protein, partial [Acidisphaera rubrifaciens]